MHENCPISTISYKLFLGGHLQDATKHELSTLTAAKHIFCILMKTSPRIALDALGALAADHPDIFPVYVDMVKMINEGVIPCAKNGGAGADKETDPKLN